MKHLRLWVTLGIFGLFAAAGWVSFLHAQAAGDQELRGWSYVTIVTDTAGNFVSREVMTLHADYTMSVVDSGQGGPTFFFSSQLGSWKPNGNAKIIARTVDFDFPPNVDVGRLDYTISFTSNRSQVAGTIIFTTFPLENGNPLNGGGTVKGTFTFTGKLITP
jgi:hypothetical protein